MNFDSSIFGNIIFGSGIFGSIGGVLQTGINWDNACPVLSAWSNKDIDNTAWINQVVDGDNWKKIQPDIKNSNPCRRI